MFSCGRNILVIFASVIFLQPKDALCAHNHGGDENYAKTENVIDNSFIRIPHRELPPNKASQINNSPLNTIARKEPLTATSLYGNLNQQDGGKDSNEHVIPAFLNHKNWQLLNQNGHCGLSKVLLTKSMGGREASLGEYPWMARLIYRELEEEMNQTSEVESFMCGGSLITRRYVLTAAHCCLRTLVYVRLGELDSHRTRDCRRGICAPRPVNVDVENITINQDYNSSTFFNDICLIRLAEDVEFTDYVQPICLPVSDKMIENQFMGVNMTVAGWGSLENYPSKRVPSVLQEVEVQIRPGENCSDFYLEAGAKFDWDIQICAGGSVGRNPCPGDSGGPLMYRQGDQRQYLLGIVSAGMMCSHTLHYSGTPYSDVFTRVSSFITFILDTIRA